VEAAIAAGENFNVIYAHNDGMARGAMTALQAAGISHGADGDVWIMGFDFNRFALRYVMSGDWNFNGQMSPFQAEIIYGFIRDLEAGRTLNLPANKMVILDEQIADRNNISQAFIDRYGLGD
jgi:simple sugar transport system substrate-binding protein